MSEWPTWKDRQGYGREIPVMDVVTAVANAPRYGGLEWQHIGFIATMFAETHFKEWSRPVVWAPGEKHHLSIDRGLCALNSFYWKNVPDSQAYDYEQAINAATGWCGYYSEERVKGSRPWDWRPLLDWQWHAYGTNEFKEYVPVAREAVNVERAARGMASI